MKKINNKVTSTFSDKRLLEITGEDLKIALNVLKGNPYFDRRMINYGVKSIPPMVDLCGISYTA